MELEVCIFDKGKVAVIYRLDSGLRLHAIILNGREVKLDRRFRTSMSKLLKLITRLLNVGYDMH